MIIHVTISLLIIYILKIFLKRQGQKSRLRHNIERRKIEQKWNFDWAQNSFEKLSETRATEITNLEFSSLQEALQNGKITPFDALRAYQRKAFEAHQKTNCVCLFILEANSIAEKLENDCLDQNYQKPPLFGIPVSIKESIEVKFMDSTQGLAQKLFSPSKNHSTTVEQLIRLGAIPFVHTNVPQALLSFGCCNPIYGSTRNPHDVQRVPGGSSGGEAALIALGGSPLGIGTDVGGSIRTPATFCGIAGFKSSSERTDHMGKVATIPGRQMLVSTDGPLASTIDVCVEYLKLKWNDPILYEADAYMAPVNFQQDLYTSTKKLTIGYYTDDGYQKAPMAYRRAVQDTIRILKEDGHNLVEFQVPEPIEMFSIFCAGATADGGMFLNRTLGDDIVPDECNIGFPITRLPRIIQRLLRKYIPYVRMRSVVQELPHSTEEMRRMHEKIEHYRDNFILALRRQNIDALVSPAFGSLPPRHGTPNQMISATSYTALYNLVDFAAGTVAVSRVSANDDIATSEMETADKWDELVKNESMNCQGLPVSVQIATPPFSEETCLRLLNFVEHKIGLNRTV